METPTAPQMAIVLPKLSPDELLALLELSEVKQATFPAFYAWLESVVVDEVQRRQEELREPQMLTIPTMPPSGTADMLAGAYVLSNMALTVGLCEFADELLQFVVCDAAAVLKALDSSWSLDNE